MDINFGYEERSEMALLSALAMMIAIGTYGDSFFEYITYSIIGFILGMGVGFISKKIAIISIILSALIIFFNIALPNNNLVIQEKTNYTNQSTSPSKELNEQLLIESEMCNYSSVKKIIREGGTLYKNEALFTVVNLECNEIVKLLLDIDININFLNKDVSLLHVATIKNNKDLVKILLTHGADINVKTNKGITPLMIASFQGNLELVKLLVENSADINMKSYQGLSVLDYSIFNTLINLLSEYSKKQINTEFINKARVHHFSEFSYFSQGVLMSGFDGKIKLIDEMTGETLHNSDFFQNKVDFLVQSELEKIKNMKLNISIYTITHTISYKVKNYLEARGATSWCKIHPEHIKFYTYIEPESLVPDSINASSIERESSFERGIDHVIDFFD